MERIMEKKVQDVHKRLNAFELHVLESPASIVDVSTFQQELSSLYADIDTLLPTPPKTELESAPNAPVDELVMTALFGNDMPPPDSSHAAGKGPCFGRTSDGAEAQRLKKNERQQLEEATRVLILDEEMI
uniref:Integrase core domain containing protein n=1 Tax=Solanum tuberosum TaxID=4113 RepID=M1DKP5_SOLTU